jgi:hypothetical protein
MSAKIGNPTANSSMAQRKRAGLITRRSLDRNQVLLDVFFAFRLRFGWIMGFLFGWWHHGAVSHMRWSSLLRVTHAACFSFHCSTMPIGARFFCRVFAAGACVDANAASPFRTFGTANIDHYIATSHCISADD